jgi:hypothetical protein
LKLSLSISAINLHCFFAWIGKISLVNFYVNHFVIEIITLISFFGVARSFFNGSIQKALILSLGASKKRSPSSYSISWEGSAFSPFGNLNPSLFSLLGDFLGDL